MNKKKFISIILSVFCILCMTVPAYANSTEEYTCVRYLEDGSYFVETIVPSSETRAASTVSGKKDTSYYNKNSVLQWTVTVYGTFSYTYGVSSSCTSASVSTDISESSWSCSTKNAYASGNSAIATATMIAKSFGIQVDSIDVALSLSCDKYGKLS